MQTAMKGLIARICFLLAMLSASASTVCGQDAILSQFFSSPTYMNPAFAGTGAGYRMVLNFRSHPFPDASNFSTLNAAVDVYAPTLSGGLGLLVNSDYLGNMAYKNHIDAIYAYHLQLSQNWQLNFGMQAGYYRTDLRWGNLEFTDPSQPPPEQDHRHAPNFGAGLLVYGDWLYGGLATHHLTRPPEGFYGDQRLPMKHTAHAGIYLQPNPVRRANTLLFDYFVSPNVIFQSQGPFQRINYGLYLGIESVMAGAWFRHDLDNANQLIFLVGLTLDNIRIGYSYDHSLSGYSDAFNGIHEISLSYSIFSARQKLRERIIRCPQF